MEKTILPPDISCTPDHKWVNGSKTLLISPTGKPDHLTIISNPMINLMDGHVPGKDATKETAAWGWKLRVVMLLVGCLSAFECAAVIRLPQTNHLFRSDRILVKVRDTVAPTALSSLQSATGTTMRRSYPSMGNLQVLQLPPGLTVNAALHAYRASELVEYAEPDFIVHAARVPNETRYFDGSLYHLFNWGQLGGTAGSDISAAAGWDLAHDATPVLVSVLDTGVRVTHEDLGGNLWINTGEIPGNGVDDDSNGYIDDVNGINAFDGTGNLTDDFGHGTHVAGILGAVGNNGIGVVGAAWHARMINCKFLNLDLQGSVSDAIECIEYSRVNGARIINASWGDRTPTPLGSQALYDAIGGLRAAGIIFVAAAGNHALDNDTTNTFYPASFDLDNIISVAATTRDDDLAHFSNYGLNSVDLGAPGYIVFSTWSGHDSDYRTDDGTSMAAPLVAAACALAWTLYPEATYQQIIARVLAGTDPIPALAGKCRTGGRLNLHKVLTGQLPSPGTMPPVLTVQSLDAGMFSIRVSGEPNTSFELQSSAGFEKAWSPGSTYQISAQGWIDLVAPAGGDAKFYRAVVR
jgi:subtilisin family serine protease